MRDSDQHKWKEGGFFPSTWVIQKAPCQAIRREPFLQKGGFWGRKEILRNGNSSPITRCHIFVGPKPQCSIIFLLMPRVPKHPSASPAYPPPLRHAVPPGTSPPTPCPHKATPERPHKATSSFGVWPRGSSWRTVVPLVLQSASKRLPRGQGAGHRAKIDPWENPNLIS